MSKILKAGDLITFVDGSKTIIGIGKNGDGLTIEEIERHYDVKIKEVVRPRDYLKVYTRNKILDEAEKRYLKAVIRPFKYKVTSIEKVIGYTNDYYIRINLKNDDNASLPYFKKNTMYKGMKIDKEYTLKELGLYE